MTFLARLLVTPFLRCKDKSAIYKQLSQGNVGTLS